MGQSYSAHLKVPQRRSEYPPRYGFDLIERIFEENGPGTSNERNQLSTFARERATDL